MVVMEETADGVLEEMAETGEMVLKVEGKEELGVTGLRDEEQMEKMGKKDKRS
jgi:hypothetical protein